MILKKCFFMLLLMCFGSLVYAQEQTITGVVSDGNIPMPGASVLVKGTDNGTITDFDGNYSIRTNTGETLVFSYVGYKSVEQIVGSKNVINITLQEDAESLDEVVLTALGFVEKRDKMSATYSKINADDLVQPVESKIIDGMAGKAAGVNISATSGDPGAGANIQIRGTSSLGGSSQPLIIVDGVPLNNDNVSGSGNSDSSGGVSNQSRLNDINPEDIETFQVFKGASAGALYGSRALNGVIVITTKKGKKGRISATFTSGFSVDKVSFKHPLQKEYGQGRNGSYSPIDTFSWGDRISERAGGQDVVATGSGQFFSHAELDPDREDIYIGYFESRNGNVYNPIPAGGQYAADGTKLNEHGGKRSRNVYVDENFDKAFQSGVSLDNKFSISGGNEKGTFYLSGGHIKQEGVVRSSFYKKTNFTVAVAQNLSDRLTANVKGNFIHTGSNRTQQGSNTAGLYLGLLRNPADFDITDYIGDYHSSSGEVTQSRHRSYRRYLGNSNSAIYNNPLWTLNEQKSTTSVNRLIGTADLSYKWNDHITSVLRGGFDFYSDGRIYFFPKFSSDGNQTGTLDDEIVTNQEYSMDAITSFRYQLADNFNSNFILGYGINDRRRKIDYTSADNFIANFRNPLDAAEISAKENVFVEITRTLRRNIRFYGTANFDYSDQLFLVLGGAYEKHSVLPKNKNGFFYPSAELGWIFTKAIINTEPLSFGKIRLAYGQVANVPLAHQEQTVFEVGSFSSFSDGIALEDFGGGYQLDEKLGNSNLKPEIKTEYEVGLDLRFLKNRIALSTTYYQNKTEDVLLDISIPASLGFDEIYGNGATIENKGVEVEFKYDFIKNKVWKASTAINFSTNKSLVSKIAGGGVVSFTPGASIQSVAIEGEPLGVLYTQGAMRNPDGSLALDVNGFPQVDTTGDIIVGDPNPDWRGGIQFDFSYKGLSLSALFDTSQGNDFAERTRFITSYFGTHADVGNTITLTEDLVNYNGDVVPAGTTVRANIGDFGDGNVLLDESYYRGLWGFGDGKLNEFAVHDGSWTRLREVSLSYTLNSENFKKVTGLSSVEFTASGRNLAIWTDVVGIDPDINQFGVGRGKGLDYFSNPGSKNYAFSVKFNY